MSFSISDPSTRTSTSLRGSTHTTVEEICCKDSTAHSAPCSAGSLSAIASAFTPAVIKTKAPQAAGLSLRSSPGLEQRRWTPLPGFPFLLGNILHVVYISPSLSQHMVQIVSHADKCEALVQKLPNPRRPEQEQP